MHPSESTPFCAPLLLCCYAGFRAGAPKPPVVVHLQPISCPLLNWSELPHALAAAQQQTLFPSACATQVQTSSQQQWRWLSGMF
eukprot:356534-Chlamydomonas_euryale.AAC.14